MISELVVDGGEVRSSPSVRELRITQVSRDEDREAWARAHGGGAPLVRGGQGTPDEEVGEIAGAIAMAILGGSLICMFVGAVIGVLKLVIWLAS